jgi:hypothetical protein
MRNALLARFDFACVRFGIAGTEFEVSSVVLTEAAVLLIARSPTMIESALIEHVGDRFVPVDPRSARGQATAMRPVASLVLWKWGTASLFSPSGMDLDAELVLLFTSCVSRLPYPLGRGAGQLVVARHPAETSGSRLEFPGHVPFLDADVVPVQAYWTTDHPATRCDSLATPGAGRGLVTALSERRRRVLLGEDGVWEARSLWGDAEHPFGVVRSVAQLEVNAHETHLVVQPSVDVTDLAPGMLLRLVEGRNGDPTTWLLRLATVREVRGFTVKVALQGESPGSAASIYLIEIVGLAAAKGH